MNRSLRILANTKAKTHINADDDSADDNGDVHHDNADDFHLLLLHTGGISVLEEPPRQHLG